MPYQDFREFLGALRREGQLVDLDRPIALDDVGKALKKSYEREGPALMFKRNGTAFLLVGGVYSTRKKALLAFEASEETLFQKLWGGLSKPIPPELVAGPPPCQDVVLLGDEIDIRKFPIPTYSPLDGGPYITAGITTSVDPETGVPDIGHYRFMLLDGRRLTFFAEERNRFGKNLAKFRSRGAKPYGAIVVGVDPVLAYACQFKVPDSTNDWHLAGGLRGAPVQLTRCRTVDLQVPATAEVVIEFEVDDNNLVKEGPLGEHTGYYDAMCKQQPVAIITAITHRKAPIFQALLTGKPVTENHILKQIPLELSFSDYIKRQFPSVERVSMRLASSVSNYVVIAMKPRYAGEVRQVILSAFASPLRAKWVIVVDTDIDVHDPAEVEWAMSFRVRPHEDILVLNHMPRAGCDPSVPNPDDKAVTHLFSSAVGVDATMPFGEPFPQVADVPGWRDFKLPEIDRS